MTVIDPTDPPATETTRPDGITVQIDPDTGGGLTSRTVSAYEPPDTRDPVPPYLGLAAADGQQKIWSKISTAGIAPQLEAAGYGGPDRPTMSVSITPAGGTAPPRSPDYFAADDVGLAGAADSISGIPQPDDRLDVQATSQTAQRLAMRRQAYADWLRGASA